MKRVLIDTSSWIEALRKKGDEATRERVKRLLIDGAAVTCDFVLLELFSGARGQAEVDVLRAYQAELICLPTDTKVWALAHLVARRCRAGGVNVPAADVLIACCASAHDVGLEHRDTDFELIARHISR